MPLQTVLTFLINYHLANGNYVLFSYKLSTYKLYLCFLFLQTIILQTVSLCSFLANYHLANCICVLFFSLQHWALSYGHISRGTDVNLKVLILVRAHLNSLTSDLVSEIPFFKLLYILMVSF